MPASSSKSLKDPRPPTKCVHFNELILLIDYRAVPPVSTDIDIAGAYLEQDPQDRDNHVVTPLRSFLHEDWEMMLETRNKEKHTDKKLAVATICKGLQCATPMTPVKGPPKYILLELTFLVTRRLTIMAVTLKIISHWPTSNSQAMNS